jgi:hypothetical protein
MSREPLPTAFDEGLRGEEYDMYRMGYRSFRRVGMAKRMAKLAAESPPSQVPVLITAPSRMELALGAAGGGEVAVSACAPFCTTELPEHAYAGAVHVDEGDEDLRYAQFGGAEPEGDEAVNSAESAHVESALSAGPDEAESAPAESALSPLLRALTIAAGGVIGFARGLVDGALQRHGLAPATPRPLEQARPHVQGLWLPRLIEDAAPHGLPPHARAHSVRVGEHARVIPR